MGNFRLQLPDYDRGLASFLPINQKAVGPEFLQNLIAQLFRQKMLEEESKQRASEDKRASERHGVFMEGAKEDAALAAERIAKGKQADLVTKKLEQNPQLKPGWDVEGPSLEQVMEREKDPDNYLPPPEMADVTGIPSEVPGGADRPPIPVRTRWQDELQKRMDDAKLRKQNMQKKRDEAIAGGLKPGEVLPEIPLINAPEVKGPEKEITAGMGRTIEKVGKDGKPHIYQLNPRTNEYDKDLGPAYVRPVAESNPQGRDDAKVVAQEIIDGRQPPELTGLYRNSLAVRAEMGRQKFDLRKAKAEWDAVKRTIATLNGSKQVTIRASIETASELVNSVEQAYKDLQAIAPKSGFKILNRAALGAMKQLPGAAGAAAVKLENQIADLNADLGNIYMGGNSPTDHALKLAEKAFNSEWNPETFMKAVETARENIRYRKNAILSIMPIVPGQVQGETPKPATPGGKSGTMEDLEKLLSSQGRL